MHQKAELSFLIDVRAKMQAGKGAGYARWAKVFNPVSYTHLDVYKRQP